MSRSMFRLRGGAGGVAAGMSSKLQARLQARMRDFASARDGNIAILFAVMLGVILLFAGGALDYTRRNSIRNEMVEALDAAGLAIAQLDALNGPEIRDLSATEREAYLKNYGRTYFNSNFRHANLVENLQVDFDIKPDTITPSATGIVRALILPAANVALTGRPSPDAGALPIDNSIEVKRAQVGNTEVALVLDTTGSMGLTISGSSKTKIESLKDAAKELVDILVRDDQTDYYSKVAIAPFSYGVNADPNADAVRGAPPAPIAVTGVDWRAGAAKTITGVTWKDTSDLDITNITRANPAVVTTASAHGFAVNDVVYVRGVSGNPPPISTAIYTVSAIPSSTTFRLTGVSSSRNYNSSSSDFVTRCKTSSCEIVVTSASHGLSTGDTVYITGVGGTTQINGSAYAVRRIDANQVALQSISGVSYGNYTSGGTMTKCRNAACNEFVTASSHGFSTNDRVFLAGVGGVTQINNSVPSSTASSPNNFWQITKTDANTFSLNNSFGPSYSTYTSGGNAFCTTNGCRYYYFLTPGGGQRLYQISTCVSERTGDNAYTDAAPSTAYLGRVYLPGGQSCAPQKITPLSTSKSDLDASIDALSASGATAGHLGLAWGWYLVSPKFKDLFTGDSAPAEYTQKDVVKAVVLMTDGEFNIEYCNGVATSSINCSAPNGTSFTQADALCTAIKASKVTLYTVGFDLGSQQSAADFMARCATDASHAYLATDGDELLEAFKKIAQDIRRLRISR